MRSKREIIIDKALDILHRTDFNEDGYLVGMVPMTKTRNLRIELMKGGIAYLEITDADNEPLEASNVYFYDEEDKVISEINYLIDITTNLSGTRPASNNTEAKNTNDGDIHTFIKTWEDIEAENMRTYIASSAEVNTPNKNINVSVLDYEDDDTSTSYSSDATIFDYLEESGFDYLLPEQKSIRDDYEPDFDELYIDEDDINEDEEDNMPIAGFQMEDNDDDYSGDALDQHKALQALKGAFHCTELSDSEILRSSPWELLGISAKQFHSIKATELSDYNFEKFSECLKKDIIISAIPDVNDRIRYAILIANTNSHIDTRKNTIQYILKIAKSTSLNTAVQTVQTYNDYIRLRTDAIQYNDRFIRGNENPPHPYYKYPEFPKLSTLKDLHDKAARDSITYDSLINSENNKILDSLIKERISAPEYKQFLYKGKDFSVIPATCIADLVNEGKFLDHCIGTYGASFANGESNIYFIRKNDELATPFYSAEIIVHPLYNELTQLYTYKDRTEKTEKFRAFCIEWVKEKNLRVGCII